MTLPYLEEKWIENPTVVSVGRVHARCTVIGTKRQDVVGVSVNGGHCVVPFQRALSPDQTKPSSFLPPMIYPTFCYGFCIDYVCCCYATYTQM